jgi:hypothetical protein
MPTPSQQFVAIARRGKMYVGFTRSTSACNDAGLVIVSDSAVFSGTFISKYWGLSEPKRVREETVSPIVETKHPDNLACRVNRQIKQDAHIQASPRCRISVSLLVDNMHFQAYS